MCLWDTALPYSVAHKHYDKYWFVCWVTNLIYMDVACSYKFITPVFEWRQPQYYRKEGICWQVADDINLEKYQIFMHTIRIMSDGNTSVAEVGGIDIVPIIGNHKEDILHTSSVN